jgi:MFS transporter, ACS family, solute carrier family 17 (sodium-dependent inorganic phosphate cotransporter), other
MIVPSENSTATATANSTAFSNATAASSSAMAIATEAPYISSHNSPRFEWDEAQKQLILGSFFWGYVLTELPGGRLAELIGGHRVFGHSMFWASVITLVTPVTAHMGFKAMVILRALLGFMLGGNILLRFK